MNQTFIDNLIIAGVAILAYGAEQYHFVPAGTANIILAIVGGAVVGQARAITNANTIATAGVSAPQATITTTTPISVTPEKG